ncbi:MAG: hypothetical protein LKF06_03775 [Prevotella sp.]|nr:hypothetical protein [Prevotella sp.]
MRYDKLTIIGLPKKFKVYYALDYLYPGDQLPDNPDDILYDEWPTDGEEGEDAMMAYEYNKSATGVYVAYNETVHALSFELSSWASDADVSLYVKLVNAVLKKHPRTKLYAQCDILKGLMEEDEKKMIADRQSYVKHLLKTKEGFTMEGLFHGFTLKVAHLRPAPTLDIQARDLRQLFADMQWEKGEEEEEKQ